MSTAGLALAGLNEACRTLIDSQLSYTRKLKHRFLCGPARFLIHGQDATGIGRLERILSKHNEDTFASPASSSRARNSPIYTRAKGSA